MLKWTWGISKPKKNTHFKSETSLPRKLITLDVNIKLEKTVKSPAIPANKIKNKIINTTKTCLLHKIKKKYFYTK